MMVELGHTQHATVCPLRRQPAARPGVLRRPPHQERRRHVSVVYAADGVVAGAMSWTELKGHNVDIDVVSASRTSGEKSNANAPVS